jgi:hypothetical protein
MTLPWVGEEGIIPLQIGEKEGGLYLSFASIPFWSTNVPWVVGGDIVGIICPASVLLP